MQTIWLQNGGFRGQRIRDGDLAKVAEILRSLSVFIILIDFRL